jgi:hypothetical protein
LNNELISSEEKSIMSSIISNLSDSLQITLKLTNKVAKTVFSFADEIGGYETNNCIWNSKQIFQAHLPLRGVDGLTILLTTWQMEPYIDWTLFDTLKAYRKLR